MGKRRVSFLFGSLGKSVPRPDALLAGAGPAGLAAAIELALRGLAVTVVEQRKSLPEKACGEGILAPGVAWLAERGVLDVIHPDARFPIQGVELVGGAKFPTAALGIARTVLIHALAERARALGVTILLGHPLEPRSDVALTILATGLPRCQASRRFGIRRHFATAPWSDSVELHYGPRGTEAYVTPISPSAVNVAILSDRRGERWESLLALFPRLARHLGSPLDRPRGAWPLGHRPTTLVQGRTVRIGDAACAVDPIGGEGVSLALISARALGEHLHELHRYEAAVLDAYHQAKKLAEILQTIPVATPERSEIALACIAAIQPSCSTSAPQASPRSLNWDP